MKNLFQIIVYCLLLLPVSIVGQDSIHLPNFVVKKIKQTQIEELFSVADLVKYDKQILRVNELVFAPNAILEFTNMNYEWIAIIADKIKFAAPTKRAVIRRSPGIIGKRGSRGEKGANGVNSGRSGRHGRPGGIGQDGNQGGLGETLNMPDIYIITNQIIGQQPSEYPDYINLKLIFPGIDGGDGGVGGIGGNGGRGGNGRKGSDGPIGCRSGGGDGGIGGTSGKGGKGGNAGNGSNGSTIYLIGKSEAVDVLSFSTIINQGGDSGYSGFPGDVGLPGDGGSMGRGSRWCGGGKSGISGKKPNPINLGYGNNGVNGEKGQVFKITISSLYELGF